EEIPTVFGVASRHLLEFAALREFFERVGARHLEQPIPPGRATEIRRDERLRDQVRDAVEDIRAGDLVSRRYCTRRLQCDDAGKSPLSPWQRAGPARTAALPRAPAQRTAARRHIAADPPRPGCPPSARRAAAPGKGTHPLLAAARGSSPSRALPGWREAVPRPCWPRRRRDARNCRAPAGAASRRAHLQRVRAIQRRR